MLNKPEALALTFLLLTNPLAAEPTKSQRAEVVGLWTLAFEDWAPVLTCGATIASYDELFRGNWLEMRGQALDAMKAVNWPSDDLVTLTAKSELDAMRLPPDVQFSEVLDYCGQHPEWFLHANRLDMLNISKEVERVLTGVAP